LQKVDGPVNAIYVDGDATGSTPLLRKRARFSAHRKRVVSDIADIARISEECNRGEFRTIPKILRDMRVKRWMMVVQVLFRFSALDKPGVLSKISGILGNYNISIASVIQKGRRIGEAVPLVVLSHEQKKRICGSYRGNRSFTGRHGRPFLFGLKGKRRVK